MSNNANKKSWWHTLPGVLTAAAVITAFTGLIAGLHQTGWFSDSVDIQPPSAVNGPSAGDDKPLLSPTDTCSAQAGTCSTQAGPGPQAVGSQRLQNSLTCRSRLFFYDFDAGAQLAARTIDVDFFFKPDGIKDLNTIGDIHKYINIITYASSKMDLEKTRRGIV